MDGSNVKVRLECQGCREVVRLCMPVPRHVPPKIACDPGPPLSIGGGGAGSQYRCQRCGRCWNLTAAQLQELVAERVRRHLGEAMRAGAVVIACG